MIIKNAHQFDTPYLAVEIATINENIQKLIAMFGGTTRLRPHVKTHKSPQVVKLLINAGIYKFKCATISEAEMVAMAGGVDILLAYPVIGPKISRFMELNLKYAHVKFSCLTSDKDNAAEIAEAARQAGISINIFLDINTGMNRTGTKPGTAAEALYLFCNTLSTLKINGLHAYDGHLTNPDCGIRLKQAEEGFKAVQDLSYKLQAADHRVETIVAGSTPTLNFYAGQQSVECSPGTFIYWDQHYQDHFPELPFKPAAAVVTRVIDIAQRKMICLDLGYKAVSSEDTPEKCVKFADHPDFKITGQSEEHMIIKSLGVMPDLGEVIIGLPYHIGRTCNLYRECQVVTDSEISGHWQLISGER